MTYTPETFGLQAKDLVVIGTVALVGGPVSISMANMPKIAVSQTAGQHASIKSVGKEDAMFTITAIYGDEFIKDDIKVSYMGTEIPADMISLLAMVDRMPFVPIYSDKLFKLLGYNDNQGDCVFAVMNSIRVTAIADFEHGYEVTMSFIPTNIASYSGGFVTFKDRKQYGSNFNDIYLSKMYYSDYIKNKVAERRKEMLNAAGFTQDIYIGLNTESLINSYDTYSRRIISYLKTIPTEYTQDINLEELETYFRGSGVEDSISVFGTHLNDLLESSAFNSDSFVIRRTGGYTKPTTLVFRNISNISVGYDNYIAPTYLDGSNQAMHTFMGRSPISAEINIIFEKPEDVSAIKLLYSKLQDMVRNFDFLGYNMPCEIGGEPLAMFGTSKATITRLDASSVPEIPGSFNMKINLADGTRGIMDENIGAGQFTVSNKMISRLMDSIMKDLADSFGLHSTNQIMQHYIENGPDKIMQSFSSNNQLLAEYAASGLSAVYNSIIGYALIGTIVSMFISAEDIKFKDVGLYKHLVDLVGTDESLNKSDTEMLRNSIIERLMPGYSTQERYTIAKKLAIINYIFDDEHNSLGEDDFKNNGLYPLLVKYVSTSNEIKAPFFDLIFGDVDKKSLRYLEEAIGDNLAKKDINGNPPLPTKDFTNYVIFNRIGGETQYSEYLTVTLKNNRTFTEYQIYTVDDYGAGDYDLPFGVAFIVLYDLLKYFPYDPVKFSIFSSQIKGPHYFGPDNKTIRPDEDVMKDRLLFARRIYESNKHLTDSGVRKIIANLETTIINLEKELGKDYSIENFDISFASKINFDFSNSSDISESVVNTIIPASISGSENLSPPDYLYTNIDAVLMSAIGNYTQEEISDIQNQEDLTGMVTIGNMFFLKNYLNEAFGQLLNTFNSFLSKFINKLLNSRHAMAKFLIAETSFNAEIALGLEKLISFLKLPITMYNIDPEAIYGPTIAKEIKDQMSFPSVIDEPDEYYGNNIDRKAFMALTDQSLDLSRYLSEILTSGSEKSLIEGELVSSDNGDLGNYFAGIALSEVNHIREWHNDAKDTGRYKDIMLNQILSGNSNIYSETELQALIAALEKEKLIEIEAEGAYIFSDKFILNEDSDSDKKVIAATERFLELMESHRTNSKYGITTDERSEIFNKISIDNAISGAENSIPNLADINPKFYVAFMWTKQKIFMPINYLFEYKAIVSIDIQKSREDPAHKAIVVLSNASRKLMDNMPNDTQVLEIQNQTEDSNFIGPNVDKLLVKPGVGIGIYCLYKGRNIRLFEGTITSSSFEDITVTIIADGYGADLLKPVFRNDTKLGGACTNPREMVMDALMKTESERFGIDTGRPFVEFIERIKQSTEDRKWLRIYSDRYLLPNFRYREAAANVYAPDAYWPVLTNKLNASFEQYFADYKAKAGYSAWDVITDAVNRVPGFIAYPMEYDIGEARLFFGKPEWFYRFTRVINPGFWERMANVTNEKAARSADSLLATMESVLETLASSFQFEVKSMSDAASDQITVVLVDKVMMDSIRFYIPKNVDQIGDQAYEPFSENSSDYVYDGDTLYKSSVGYRLLGINAPELIENPVTASEKMLAENGKTSKLALKALISSGARIVDSGTLDRYGRHLVHVFISYRGKWVNAAQIMLASGYAYLYKEFPISSDADTTAKFYSYANYSRMSEEENQYLTNIYSSDYFKSEQMEKIKTNFMDDVLEHKNRVAGQINKSLAKMKDFDGQYSEITNSLIECLNMLDNIYVTIEGQVEEFLNKENTINYSAIQEVLIKGTLSNSLIDNLIRMSFSIIENAANILDKQILEMSSLRSKLINIYALDGQSGGLKNLANTYLYSRTFGNLVNVPGTDKFRKYWVAASGINLISDEIILDKSNVANEVTVLGPRSTSILETIGKWFLDFFAGQTGNTQGGKAMYTIRADDDIPDWERVPLVVQDDWADTTQSRILVATSILMNSLKNMYQGVIRITGNPEIKPHDIISIFDRENDVYGECVVRTVRHMYGNGVAFITELEVDPIINARDLTSSLGSITAIKAGNFIVGALAFTAVSLMTGGVGTLAYLSSVGAGLVAGKISRDISKSFLQYSNISAISQQIGEENDFRPYLNTFEGFNVLEIKPLTKSGRPMVAGINGYSLENINANEYRAKKIRESVKYFADGIKQFGYTFSYLGSEVSKEIDYLFKDLYTKNYMNKIMNGD
mgnify:CR=1 FL=1